MYVPHYYSVKDEEKVFDYIRQNGFGTLISKGSTQIHATHIPFHLCEHDGVRTLTCHIARANLQKETFDSDQEVLAIFMNTHGYVSSSWYDHVNVPTWNYIAVHVYGMIRIVEGNELIKSLEKMVEQYESDRPGRFHLNDMNDAMLQAHVNGLVGYEIKIKRIEAAYKLSQNRKDHDYKNVVQQLEKESTPESQELSKVMRESREDLFHE